MKKLILTALAAFTLLAAPSTAGAAIVHASGGAGAAGHKLLWALDYDTVSKDVTIDATHTRFDGTAALGDPQQADLVVLQPNGQDRVFDMLTMVAPSDGLPGILNKGPQTYSLPGGLRVSATRASAISFHTDYVPPLGA